MTTHGSLLLAVCVCVGLFAGCDPEARIGIAASRAPLEAMTVAAVQYGDKQATAVDKTCGSSQTPDACAVLSLITAAQKKGAKLVVAPEYGLGQKYLEADPVVGDTPISDGKWSSTSLIKSFATQAKTLGIYVVMDLQTSSGSKKYNTLVAFDPQGKVVGRHHKFELFAGEARSLTPGEEVSVFDTPMGKVGLLICADMYGDLRKHDELVNKLGARIVAVSSFWTAPGGLRWPQNYAKNWGVYVVSSNTTASVGRGGGVFAPDGRILAEHSSAAPALVIATIPAGHN